jgi:predicted ATP-grasp superfamily ATP-dependent carboligase
MIKFLILNLEFKDWISVLKQNNKFIIINENDIDHYSIIEYKLLPLSVNNHIQFNKLSYNIFNNDIKNIQIFNNKSKFAKYMLENFNDNIPITFYYNYDDHTYINTFNLNNKFIIKPNEKYSGIGVKIINKITPINNYIIQEYIEHNLQYVAHFLVYKGNILKKIYFSSVHKENEIKKGNIINYDIKEKLHIDDFVFDNIFQNLNYSGFACSDFTIINNKIIIFEINPRLGGSLLHNKKYFNIFVDCLDKIILNSL